ncbi:hypothetical protein [Arachidicoccus sp.]|uniref:hypothetical protein n=1 Tax=Arachidicoccus sp. TaxID=1872624 RepID=UPI003D1A82E8
MGIVKQYVTPYGNFARADKYEIIFDVHVIAPRSDPKDFEEMYEDEIGKRVKNLVDDNENNKGYYIDSVSEWVNLVNKYHSRERCAMVVFRKKN